LLAVAGCNFHVQTQRDESSFTFLRGNRLASHDMTQTDKSGADRPTPSKEVGHKKTRDTPFIPADNPKKSQWMAMHQLPLAAQ
jgi:hypothetical protein